MDISLFLFICLYLKCPNFDFKFGRLICFIFFGILTVFAMVHVSPLGAYFSTLIWSWHMSAIIYPGNFTLGNVWMIQQLYHRPFFGVGYFTTDRFATKLFTTNLPPPTDSPLATWPTVRLDGLDFFPTKFDFLTCECVQSTVG